MTQLKRGESVKMIDSGLKGTVFGKDKNGRILIKTDDGLIIPVEPGKLVAENKELTDVLGGLRISRIARKTTEPKGTVPTRSQKKEMSVAEIDLHIEKIVKDHKALLHDEILKRQTDRFMLELLKAISEGRRELIAIHGEGSGRLREEIRKISAVKCPSCEITDAPYYKYGFGATRIILNRK